MPSKLLFYIDCKYMIVCKCYCFIKNQENYVNEVLKMGENNIGQLCSHII